MRRRVGILGGTFDPIHCGHLDLADAARRALDLTEVLVVPSSIPPHRPQPAASSWHRFAMVALALTGRDGWRASDLELASGRSPSFTSDTLQRLHAEGFAAGELYFLTGADAFAEIEMWKDYPAVLDGAHFVVVSRPGSHVSQLRAALPSLGDRMVDVSLTGLNRTPPGNGTWIFLIDAPTADVSATAIRQRAANGQSIVSMVPPLVQQYIEQHRLYAAAPARSAAGRLHGQD
jgi:nicotinate-nucleotide adenylyltransferase